MAKRKRTKNAAKKTLMGIMEKLIDDSDELVVSLLSEDLFEEIFEQSWRNQFEDDRRQLKRVVKEIVRERIEELEIGEQA